MPPVATLHTIVRVRDWTLAFALKHVCGVLPWHEPTPIPEVAAPVGGMIQVRGGVISLIDLVGYFTGEAHTGTAGRRILVLEDGPMRAAYVIDALGENREFTAGEGGPLPPDLPHRLREVAVAAHNLSGGPVFVIDAPKLIDRTMP